MQQFHKVVEINIPGELEWEFHSDGEPDQLVFVFNGTIYEGVANLKRRGHADTLGDNLLVRDVRDNPIPLDELDHAFAPEGQD
jgi:hypothetical protein